MSTGLLFVDLDGTLLRGDSLWETAVASARQSPSRFIASLKALVKSRAAFKSRLAELSPVDAAVLPYDERVREFVRARKAAGQEVVLATAADSATAGAVARHLGLFDAVLASDGVRNNGGVAKLESVLSYAAGRSFEFVGDGDEPAALWRSASVAHVVGGARTAKRIALLTALGTVFPRRRFALSTVLRALRARQWMKNLLVFVPVVLAHRIAEPSVLLRSSAAFIAFSLAASAAYVVNDLADLGVDRAHPTKRRRPFAAGEMRIQDGIGLAAASLAASLAASAMLPRPFLAIVVGYLILTTAYTASLKRLPMVDVTVIAVCFALRVFAGGVATGIPLSGWLLAFSTFFFLSLGLLKRYAEFAMFVAAGRRGTVPGRGYAAIDADAVRLCGIVAGAVAILIMALYVTSPVVTVLYRNTGVLWLVVAVTGLWLGRLWVLASRGAIKDDPFAFATADGTSYATALVMAVTLVLASA